MRSFCNWSGSLLLLFLVVCLCALGLPATARADDPVAAPVAPVALVNSVTIVQCDSAYGLDPLTGQYTITMVVNYKVVNGGKLYFSVFDAKAKGWYAIPPAGGVVVQGNKVDTITITYAADKGSELEKSLKAGAEVLGVARLVPTPVIYDPVVSTERIWPVGN